MLVSTIKNACSQNSSVGLIIDDCTTLLHGLVGCFIVHVRRSANQVAYFLTKASISRSEFGELRDYRPSFLYVVEAFDMIQ